MRWFNVVFIMLGAIVLVSSSPMLYKKNDQQNYEADLIPVSSTVIPLTVYEVSYGLNGKITEEEYKKLYMKHLHKKVQTADNPDKLITVKNMQKG